MLETDRVETVLSECMVNHVLRSEVSLPRLYATPDELADIVDKYCANFDQNGRPRVSAIGLGPRRHPTSQGSTAQQQSLSVLQSVSKSQAKHNSPASAVTAAALSRRCFKCGSDRHLYKDCDKKGSASQWQPSLHSGNRLFEVKVKKPCHELIAVH